MAKYELFEVSRAIEALLSHGGVFTVRVEMYDGDYVWLEVSDQGGLWRSSAADGRMHGLEIVQRLASESGVAGSLFSGWEAWARLDWPGRG